MPFPDAKRIIFRKNPLTEVVCQLRFPPILKIDAEVPANFQEAIRTEFEILSNVVYGQELSISRWSSFKPQFS